LRPHKQTRLEIQIILAQRTASDNLRGAFMAVDVYLQIEGIKGESQDLTHRAVAPNGQ
jgi:hypothetical protein